MGKGIPWEQKTIAKLMELREKGMPIKNIAEVLRRSKGSVRNKICSLNLPRKDYPDYTEEEKEYVRMNYKYSKASRYEIANALGRTFGSVGRMVYELGLRRYYRRGWSNEDDDFLKEYVGNLTPKQLSKALNRTESAVISRIHLLSLHRRNIHGWLTSTQVAEILGCSSVHVRNNYIKKGKLKARSRYDTEQNIMWEIRESSLREFVLKYRYELNGRICDWAYLINLIANGNNHKKEQLDEGVIDTLSVCV